MTSPNGEHVKPWCPECEDRNPQCMACAGEGFRRAAMSVQRVKTQPGDLLDADYINGLPQLFLVSGKTLWPVHDFEVETGLFRIDVMGKLDVLRIGDAIRFQDADGTTHHPGDLYCDSESWETRSE